MSLQLSHPFENSPGKWVLSQLQAILLLIKKGKKHQCVIQSVYKYVLSI